MHVEHVESYSYGKKIKKRVTVENDSVCESFSHVGSYSIFFFCWETYPGRLMLVRTAWLKDFPLPLCNTSERFGL